MTLVKTEKAPARGKFYTPTANRWVKSQIFTFCTMSFAVKIEGFMIEKNHNHNFFYRDLQTPTTAQFYLKRATLTSTTIQLNFYTTHNHKNTTILYPKTSLTPSIAHFLSLKLNFDDLV